MNEKPYNWFRTAPWYEIAAVMMAWEEDWSTAWFKDHHRDWPDMFRIGLTQEHFGDCCKKPITCIRCMAETFHTKVAAMQAVLP